MDDLPCHEAPCRASIPASLPGELQPGAECTCAPLHTQPHTAHVYSRMHSQTSLCTHPTHIHTQSHTFVHLYALTHTLSSHTHTLEHSYTQRIPLQNPYPRTFLSDTHTPIRHTFTCEYTHRHTSCTPSSHSHTHASHLHTHHPHAHPHSLVHICTLTQGSTDSHRPSHPRSCSCSVRSAPPQPLGALSARLYHGSPFRGAPYPHAPNPAGAAWAWPSEST